MEHDAAQDGFEEVAAVMRSHWAAQGFTALIGAELLELAPGVCVIGVDRRPELLQQYGMFHGGVIAFLVDNATTIAAHAAAGPGRGALTAEYKLNLLTPAMGERLLCRARVVRAGRTLSVAAADVFSLSAGAEKLVATALATLVPVDLKNFPLIGGASPAGS
jgi:uncharacterized protein (TIGR00369 family)